jgi:hypothetical protein
LAEDDGDLFVEGDAVAEVGAAALVGFDGLFHEGMEGFFGALGDFVDADDEFVVGLEGVFDFVSEGVDGHGGSLGNLRGERKEKGRGGFLTTDFMDGTDGGGESTALAAAATGGF